MYLVWRRYMVPFPMCVPLNIEYGRVAADQGC
jgi:hypothetical protein